MAGRIQFAAMTLTLMRSKPMYSWAMSILNPWDERYGTDEYVYGTEPNAFLRAEASRLRGSVDILCLAEGEGRNSTYLASLGHRVTGVDASRKGIEKIQRLAAARGVVVNTVLANLMDYDLGDARYVVIVSIFAHLPREISATLRPRVVRAIREGGLFILEHYHPRQLDYKTGGPPDPTMMATLAELYVDFDGWEILHAYEGERVVIEGKFHQGKAYVTQFVARKQVLSARLEPS
ncbi:MAG TPA: class I SAM-dependent methyltransferase [Polyangiaceae bacterium]|nr:class I SAM-dependent methyltransferase [Polyangiaceae bacterium]